MTEETSHVYPPTVARPPRRLLFATTVAAVVVSALAVVSSLPATAAPVCRTSAPASGAFNVTVCLTVPVSGATVTGDATVAATVSVSNGRAVRNVQFGVGNEYVLTDFESPFTFELPSARWPNGSRSLRVRAVIKGTPDFTTPYTFAPVTFANDGPPQASAPFSPREPVVAEGTPLIVAAVGDGANGNAKSVAVVDRIARWSPQLFLYLGDVYARGTHTEFRNWFAPTPSTYGRFASITNPTVGNHEYEGVPTGEPYFSFWGGVPHAYSFDAGGWHFVSLDTTETYAQTTPGTEQFEWLRDDLRASRADCTLVYYHHPVFSRGTDHEDPRLLELWALLADEGVDLVLNGHAHHYVRWQPIGADRVANGAGPVQITVGSGGHFLYPFTRSDPRAAVGNATKFGALRLELLPGEASYAFYASGGSVLDRSSRTCTPFIDRDPPTAPVLSAEPVSETSASLSWTEATDDVAVTGYRILRDGIEIASLGPEQTTYLDEGADPGATVSYVVEAFDATGAATASNLVTLTLPSPSPSPSPSDGPSPSPSESPSPSPEP